MKTIGSLSVSKISLLTSEHIPAVPKAGTKFSILKFFTRKSSDNPDVAKLDSIIEKLSKPQTQEPDKISEIIEKMENISGK